LLREPVALWRERFSFGCKTQNASFVTRSPMTFVTGVKKV
jgi:hypothetical protein